MSGKKQRERGGNYVSRCITGSPAYASTFPLTLFVPRLRFSFPAHAFRSPIALFLSRSRFIFTSSRTGVRVAEGAGLENRYTLAGIVGSNPTLSVTPPDVANPLIIESAPLPCFRVVSGDML